MKNLDTVEEHVGAYPKLFESSSSSLWPQCLNCQKQLSEREQFSSLTVPPTACIIFFLVILS